MNYSRGSDDHEEKENIAPVQWRVLNKIKKWGENLTLFCPANSKKSNESFMWHMAQLLLAWGNTSANSAKYEARVVPNIGSYLDIKQFGEEDSNETYSCTRDFSRSEEILSADDVFKNSTDNVLELDKDKTNSIWTVVFNFILSFFLQHIGVVTVAVALIIFMVSVIVCLWKQKKKRDQERVQPSVRYTVEVESDRNCDVPTYPEVDCAMLSFVGSDSEDITDW